MSEHKRKKRWNRIKRSLYYLGLVSVLIVFIFPVFWVVLTSVKPNRFIVTLSPVWVFAPTSQHFRQILFEENFQFYFINSTIIASATTAITIVISLMAAYSLARLKFKGSDRVAFWILSMRMLPPIATAIPLYILYQKSGLLGTHLGIIIAHLTFIAPFGIWILYGFLKELPPELEEAALVDGCNRLGALFRIIVPIAKPAIAITAIFSFMFSWNEFLFAVLLGSSTATTIPMKAGRFVQQYSIDWGPLSAWSILALIPLIVAVFLLNKHIVRGLTLGAVKG